MDWCLSRLKRVLQIRSSHQFSFKGGMKMSSRLPSKMLSLGVMLASGSLVVADCPDTDGNSAVDVDDILSIVNAWGPCQECPEDLDESGIVDVADVLLVLGGWGECDDVTDPGTGAYNYGEVLQKSLSFYLAQRAGDLPQDYPLDWRSDCFDFDLDQVNGEYEYDPGILNRYMDAGDTPTFVLPISSAMTTMAWSGVDFSQGFVDSGLMDELKDALRWHADWCMAAHPQPDVFCGQIGQGGESHAFWGPAEIHADAVGYTPKIWWLNPDNPGTEPVAEAAAFMAAASMVFKDSEPSYAASLLEHARDLYSFADTHRGTYTNSIPDVVPFYNSWSGYHDELAWAAAWLFRATNESAYLDKAEQHYLDASPDPNWAQSWDGKINGVAVLLAHLTGKSQYRSYVDGHLGYWLPGGGIQYSPGGLAWLDVWGSLRYAANSAFIAFAYAELVGDKPDGRYRAFGERQINYILGDNPRNSSYVCGFGENSPTQPHHRGAHGSWNNQITDPEPNRHVLWGALVGGPASPDDYDYEDVRTDYIANEVACDYNAGFTAALGYMRQTYGGEPIPSDQFPPGGDSYGNEMFVEASIIENDPGSTKIRCMLNNRSAWPARMSDGLSYRIYLDLTEVIESGFGPEDIYVQSGFLDGGALSALQASNPSSGLYFFEVSYEGESIGPGPGAAYRRESQIEFGLVAGAQNASWDIGNDPSVSSLPVGQSAILKTEMIAVYDDGDLIYGEEGVLDCNDNGIADSDEIQDGSAVDLDGNGLPDECDSDCDNDGQPDAYEIQQGEIDCDADGTPDSCQESSDCNDNGQSDLCDISEGQAIDCNGNGVPDSCDLSDGLSEDTQGDGIPDECQLQGLLWDFTLVDQWASGFTASLEIRNNTGESLTDWTLEFDVPYELTGLWPVGSELWTQDSLGHVTVRSEAWNSTIPDGGSIELGFQAESDPSIPTSILLNGIVVEASP